ncbi:hypothetical protein K491DRAFT_779721 [Lophiostoma macrostomum CBS 122681]|uniref:Uncharacterized protein n=1 Tax=Lophiostoma macrostomum CBS 122681 TaxID=1314788 RepID=A0A6A6T5J5_9PLEO|nr:hypothetical protein K491DRAFT_779721 [Lophiostoma macrostomum CBS 122681]
MEGGEVSRKWKVDTFEKVRAWTLGTLNQEGFYNVEPGQMQPTLDNAIHPLFRSENFYGFDETFYNKTRPALQLASLFLQDERMVGWFWRQMISVPTALDDYPNKQYLRPPSTTRPSDDSLRARWNQQLTDLSHVLQIHSYPPDRPVNFPEARNVYWSGTRDYVLRKGNRYGTVEAMMDSDGMGNAQQKSGKAAGFYDADGEWTGGGRINPHCILNKSWNRFFQTLPEEADLKDKEFILTLSAQFILAITLVHEIAHAVHHFPEYKFKNNNGSLREAYCSKEEMEGEGG